MYRLSKIETYFTDVITNEVHDNTLYRLKKQDYDFNIIISDERGHYYKMINSNMLLTSVNNCVAAHSARVRQTLALPTNLDILAWCGDYRFCHDFKRFIDNNTPAIKLGNMQNEWNVMIDIVMFLSDDPINDTFLIVGDDLETLVDGLS